MKEQLFDISKLVKVSTYAHDNNKSLSWGYKEITLKNVESLTIDGVVFIILNDKK